MGRKSRGKHSVKPPTVSAYTNKKEVDRLAQKLISECMKPTTKKDEWEHFQEIHFLVERIRQYQSGGKMSTRNRLDGLEAFKKWLEENGATMNKVALENYGGDFGIGLKASEDLKKGDQLIQVPYGMMMTAETAKKSYLGDFIRTRRVLAEMSNVSLSLFLHCERFNSESFFKPYIDILPDEYNTTLYYTVKEMELLKGSSAFSPAISQYKSIARQYAGFYNMMHGDNIPTDVQNIPLVARNEFTFDAYRWAVSTVSTRLNRVPTVPSDEQKETCEHDGPCHSHMPKETTLALIPLWDMINHSPGQLSTDCDPEKQFCVSYAKEDFKEDDQVTIFYGARNNIGYLVYNGFVVPENPSDYVDIQLGVSQNDKLYQKRVILLDKLGIPPSGTFQIYQTSEKIPASPDLLAFLRVFHMTEEELDSWCSKELFGSDCLKDIYMPSVKGGETDLKIWKFLENRVDLLLKVYKPTDEEAAEILADPKASEKSKLAIKYHKEMKRILGDCRDFCREFPVNPNKFIRPINKKMISKLRQEGIISKDLTPSLKEAMEMEGGERDTEVDMEVLNAVIEEMKVNREGETAKQDHVSENEPSENGPISNAEAREG